ncbi:hypothetical protein [Undibacterium flavidum]|uniref:Uncharacterized protein n=1 Tax=Undibacterium flavidum TaxID=2762297 RepID=A0ABR6Y7S5_9BURK|nr:hypothetical protein [Undibacterium flavidum]MBC3872656.1 hypothetical protein [Undibacterium flavidum]
MRKIIQALIFFTLIVNAGTSVAAQGKNGIEADSWLRDAVERAAPGYKVAWFSVGSLDKGKTEYTAAMLQKSISGSENYEIRMAIFRREKDQSYQLEALSKSWADYLGGDPFWGVEIEKQFIVVSSSSSGNSYGDDSKLLFRKMDGRFLLVGEESKSYGFTSSPENSEYRENRTSVNFLTGRAIHSRRSGPPKADPNLLGFGGKSRSKEMQFQFFKTAPIDFANFDPNSYELYFQAIANACGFINEKMKYEPCSKSSAK